MPRIQTTVREVAENTAALVELVLEGTEYLDPSETKGPNLIAVLLWDARVVFANFWKHDNTPAGQPDVEDSGGSCTLPRDQVEALVERLLKDGTPFTTLVGLSDDYCGLRWTIQLPPPTPS